MDLVSLRFLWWLLLLIPVLMVYRVSLVDRPRGTRVLALILRIVAVVLIILALCRPFVSKPVTDLHVVFLIDVSESVELADARRAVDQVQAYTEGLNSGDSWSLFFVADGVRACESVELAAEQLDQWQTILADSEFRRATRLNEALLSTRMQFPANKARRMIVFTDARETHTPVQAALDTLAQEQIQVYCQTLKGLQTPEACMVSVTPNGSQAYEGEMVRLTVEAKANIRLPAKLRLLHRAVTVQEATVILDPNSDNVFHFDVAMTTPGESVWTVELAAEQDYFQINNRVACTLTVGGKPRVLLLHETPRDMRLFRRALEEQGFSVEVRPNQGVPGSLEDMLAFDAMILASVPATDMTAFQMDLIKQYVIDFGGGLIMMGSNNSFGLGGYYKTPVEEVLPLTSRYEKEKEQPSVAMALVIDKSGSMGGAPIDLARQAAKATVELLGPRDQMGVVGFDSQAYVVSEMRSAGDVSAVCDAIDTLAAGGGTNMYPGMQTAYDMLMTTSAKIKHVIVLSDGRSQGGDHQGMAQQMADAGMTLSTIALGQADRALLSSLAEIGRGRYYETSDPSTIPKIFTKETVETSRSATKEDLFSLVQTADHPVLTGFDEAELPMILGYVMTRMKPATQLLLASDSGDPILAVSRYGLGAGMAYTSDLTDQWGTQWLSWKRCGQFWGQALRHVLRRQSTEGVYVTQQSDGATWVVDLLRTSKTGQFVTGLQWDAQVAVTTGEVKNVSCREVGLGRYRVTVPVAVSANQTLRLYDTEYDKMVVQHYHSPYPSEYNLAAQTDAALDPLEPLDVQKIRYEILATQTRQPISHWCLLLALLAMTAGILLRRI
jgi:Ca-activated chloride channel family protein